MPIEARLVQVPVKTIDDFGDVAKLREAFAPTEAKYQKMRRELNSLVAGYDADALLACTGDRYALDISACGFERKVDIQRARKKLGAAAFLKACTVTLKSLEAFLLKPEIDALAVTTQSGSRTFTVSARPRELGGPGLIPGQGEPKICASGQGVTAE